VRWSLLPLRRAAAPVTAALLTLSVVLAAEKPAPKKPQSHPSTQTAKKQAPQTQTAPAAEPSEQTQGGVTVRENYYLELPGFDLSTLTPKQKDRFLERVNKELCTCGCPNDTVARCLVNDPKCPAVRGLAEKIFNEVKAGT
jgi:hypothetical protein